jgi:hypothetical protein
MGNSLTAEEQATKKELRKQKKARKMAVRENDIRLERASHQAARVQARATDSHPKAAQAVCITHQQQQQNRPSAPPCRRQHSPLSESALFDAMLFLCCVCAE